MSNLKHASLKDTVAVLKRYRPKTSYVQGQAFTDFVTGERGREPVIATINYHADTSMHEQKEYAHFGERIGSSVGVSSVSTSNADVAKALMDPSNTVNNTVRTFYSNYTLTIAKGRNPHFAVPFQHLFASYIQQRHGEVRAMLEHPDAPTPFEFLERVCAIGYPDYDCMRDVIVSELERPDRLIGNGGLRIWHLFKRCEHLQGPINDPSYQLIDLMIRVLVSISATDAVLEALDRIPNDFIKSQTWDMLLIAVAKRKIKSAEVLWRLIGPDSFPVSSSTGQFGLSAEFATVLLTRTRSGGFSYAPPLVAKAIMTRYFEFCAATQVPLHPTPFLFFFKLIRDARATTDSTLFHWHIVWEYFQKLNTECPQWYVKFPEEAEQLCCFLVDIMLKGADPWMVLNVSRSIASRRIVDGFELSLRILRRLEPYQHHPAETKAVAKKLFTWLLDTVKIHLLPKYRPQLIPAMQVLVRLGMLSELARLHNSILDVVTEMPEQFKRDFYYAFEDVLCSSCHSMLTEHDVGVARQCPYCQAVKEPKSSRYAHDTSSSSASSGDLFLASSSASSSMSASSTVVLLAAVAELTAAGASAADLGAATEKAKSAGEGMSRMDDGVIDISAAFNAKNTAAANSKAAAATSSASTEDAAKRAVSSSSSSSPQHKNNTTNKNNKAGERGRDDNGDNAAPFAHGEEGTSEMPLRKSRRPIDDVLPQQGSVGLALRKEAALQKAMEGKKLQGFLQKLQQEQPTRQGLIERANSPLSLHAAADRKRATAGSGAKEASFSEEGATDADNFVPTVEGAEAAMEAFRNRVEKGNDVRGALEHEESRREMQMGAKRMMLQKHTSREQGGGGAASGVLEGGEDVQTTQSNEGDAASGPEAALPPFVSPDEVEESAARLQHRQATAAAGASSSASANKANASRRNPLYHPPTPSHWTCVWCQEKNVTATTNAQCGACGAETGPSASWRSFAYATEPIEEGHNNKSGNNFNARQHTLTRMIMEEIRHRILHCYENHNDGIVAAYYLMVYRRMFLLKASSSDFALVEQLVASLAASHEKVLAGYLYLRLIPAALRRLDSPALQRLSVLFGTNNTPAFTSMTAEDLASDASVCARVLGPSTCRICYGSHDWRTCPIVTRDFRTMTTRVRLTPEEQFMGVKANITNATKQAGEHYDAFKASKSTTAGQESSSSSNATDAVAAFAQPALSAYKLFLSFKQREEWALESSKEANLLSQMLSASGEMIRAAFVLCHIPLHLRENESYLLLVNHFDQAKEDAEEVLGRRSPSHIADNSHPNFVQVTMTCCICLEGKHAAFDCPNLRLWASALEKTMRQIYLDRKAHLSSPAAREKGAVYNPLLSHGMALRELKAKIEGWAYSGPERLHSLYRFLLANMDTLTATHDAHHAYSPIYVALNTTICRLVETGRRSNAWRLFAKTPVQMLNARQSVAAILKMNGVDDNTIKRVVESPTESALWVRESALPIHTHCLICFDPSHGFQQCPELISRQSIAERIDIVCSNVGAIKCTRVGVSAAVDYILDCWERCELTFEHIKNRASSSSSSTSDPATASSHNAIAKRIAQLAMQCFAGSEVFRGRRLIRLLPPEMIEEPLLKAYWKAAQVDEVADQKQAEIDNYEAIVAKMRQRDPNAIVPPPPIAVKNSLELLDDLRSFYSTHQFMPSLEKPPTFPKPAKFNTFYRNIIDNGGCDRCGERSHSMEKCLLYRNEASFSRDIIAVFRNIIVAEHISAPVLKIILMRFAKFFILYQRHLSFALRGVQKAANALTGFCAMVNEPAIALRLLLTIPPAYRQTHVFIHILHAFGQTAEQIDAKLKNFLITGDDSYNNGDAMVISFSSLRYRPPIPDVALKQLFDDVPNAITSLRTAEELILSYTDPHVVRRESERRAMMLTNPQSPLNRSRNKKGGASPSSPFGSMGPSGLDALSTAEALARLPPLSIRPVQFADVIDYRSTFDASIQTNVEEALGRKLGSKHLVYADELLQHDQYLKEQQEKQQREQQKSREEKKLDIRAASSKSSATPSTTTPQSPPPPPSHRSDPSYTRRSESIQSHEVETVSDDGDADHGVRKEQTRESDRKSSSSASFVREAEVVDYDRNSSRNDRRNDAQRHSNNRHRDNSNNNSRYGGEGSDSRGRSYNSSRGGDNQNRRDQHSRSDSKNGGNRNEDQRRGGGDNRGANNHRSYSNNRDRSSNYNNRSASGSHRNDNGKR